MGRLLISIENRGALIANLLGGDEIEIGEIGKDHCRVQGARCALHFYRHHDPEVIDSSIELHSIPTNLVNWPGHLHTWLVLHSRGEEWADLITSDGANMLDAELRRIERALPCISDPVLLTETLSWNAGYRDGWHLWD